MSSSFLPQLRLPWSECQPTEETRWVALAGAPCSGKSTLTQLLSEHFDWPIMPDYARDIYEREFAKGKNHKFLQDNVGYFQKRICGSRLDFCYDADPNTITLFDYGLPCDYAWHRYWKLKVGSNLRSACERLRYRVVFLLEPLDMQHDEVRKDSIELQQSLYRHMQRAYKKFGYNVVKVPHFSNNKEESIRLRFEFMVDTLKQYGLLSADASSALQDDSPVLMAAE